MYPQSRAAGTGRAIADDPGAVAARYEISPSPSWSQPSRTARIAWPRQLAIYLARELTGASLQTIGEAFGGRNHATVLHACKRVSERAGRRSTTSRGELDELRDDPQTVLADRDY